MNSPGLPPFAGFKEASAAVLAWLQDRAPLGLWMVTRTIGDDWIVLSAADRFYDVGEGDVFSWSSSFCTHMVRGLGPRVAPRSRQVPAYASAPIAKQIPIEAYVGVPIEDESGELFGTLCAIDPEPQKDELIDIRGDVEIASRLLSTILAAELAAVDGSRDELLASVQGVVLAESFEAWIAREEQHCRTYGDPATVLAIEVRSGDVGDAYRAVRDAAGSGRLTARTSPSRIEVIAPETGALAAMGLCEGVADGLRRAAIIGPLGVGVRAPGAAGSLVAARADAISALG